MKTVLIICLLFGLVTNEIIYSQWIQTDGPYGSTSIYGIVQNGKRIFVETNCGLHSIDSINGRWSYKANIDFKAYTKKGDSLFYGFRDGVYLLDLSNSNSEPISLGLNSFSPHLVPINAILHSDTCLYAGIEEEGFYKSIGFTNKWIACNKGLPADTVYVLGTYIFWYVYAIELKNDIIFCGTDKGIYKSNANNIIWNPVNNGIPQEKVTLIKSIHDTLFTGIGNKLFISINNGDSWNEFFSSPSQITSINKFNDIYYVTTLGNGIYISENNGLNWENYNSGLNDLNITNLDNIDTILICGTSSDGIYYNNGSDWIKKSNGIICSSIWSMTTTNKAIVTNDNDYVYISNNGISWNNITPSVDDHFFHSVVSMGDTIFLSYYSKSTLQQFIKYYSVSSDLWYDIKSKPYEYDANTYQLYTDGKKLYAYFDEKMSYTDNLGEKWIDISLPEEYCNMFHSFLIHYSVPFAAACGNAEVMKLNNQNNWILSNSGLPTDREILVLARTSDAIYAYQDVHGMYVSMDYGQSWSSATKGLEDISSFRDFAYSGKNIFVTTNLGFYYSDDYGQNWYSVNDGLINKDLSAIKVFNDTIYVGTYGNGIWKNDIGSIPLAISYNTNRYSGIIIYPNPASDFIFFNNTKYNNSEVKIVDFTGRQIVSKKMNSNNMITLTDIPNGSYIVIIKDENAVYYNKLIIKR